MNIKNNIEKIIYEAHFLEVSDIHFHPNDKYVRIYYRIIDKLVYQKKISIEEYNKTVRYLKFITKLDIAITRKPQDGSFYLEHNKKKIFVRIATIPLIRNESLVIRVLQDLKNLSFEDMAFDKKDLKVMKNTILNEIGLFIFTGPTGSGKTTTIYAIIDEIIKQDFKKVITIENPVEIINKRIMQVQIDEKLNIDYASSLKATLRQDPDIIVIGEIRDEETARNVFRAALTGHTVISTMHTKDIYGVVERFLDFGFLKSEIESVLIGVSNQRLVSNEIGEIKAVYAYETGINLQKVIKKERVSGSIESKIRHVRQTFKTNKEKNSKKIIQK